MRIHYMLLWVTMLSLATLSSSKTAYSLTDKSGGIQQRNMTYNIESISAQGFDVRITNEYPNGLALQSVDVLFSVNYPDLSRFELLEFRHEGAGNCQMVNQQDWRCTGEITYLKQEWRYRFDLDFDGQKFTVPVRAFETSATDFDLTVTYPDPAEYVSATNEPTTMEPNVLIWSVENMTQFETILTFSDPRIRHILLPIIHKS